MPMPHPGGAARNLAVTAAYGGDVGMAGERMAAGIGSFGRNVAMPVAGAGLMMSGAMGAFGDPFSAIGLGMRASTAMGGGMMGMAGGLAMAGGAMLPAYVASKAVGAYAGAFTGGIQDQTQLNSTLRQNFNFQGGQGHMGRGFGQQQMGGIGAAINQELRSNSLTNSGELNSLISGGAQAGMFQGVSSVGEFSSKFKQMLDTLKTVQKELGGSLNEALKFVEDAKTSGIFGQMDRSQFAKNVREVTQATGMSRAEAMQMSAQGAQIARSVGGTGRQGAFGAMRGASTLGAAITMGAVSKESLSEATGGLTGTDAISAFTTNMMQRTAEFSRRPMGRYALAALSNSDATGLDAGRTNQFLMGSMSIGDIRRNAHSNLSQIGRARFINREGDLRGGLLERGGMAGQIGMMRAAIGDRALSQGDDLGSLVMQRRFHMGRRESEVMMGLIRNQGDIAIQEESTRQSGQRGADRESDMAQNRSFDAFMSHLGHGLANETGVTKAREMGTRFATRFASRVEAMMDRMIGGTTGGMSEGMSRITGRIASGSASSSDFRDIVDATQRAGTRGRGPMDLESRGLFETGASRASILRGRGVDPTGMTQQGLLEEMQQTRMARMGMVTSDRDVSDMARIGEIGQGEMLHRINMARLGARAAGGHGDIYGRIEGGFSGNAIDATIARAGGTDFGVSINAGNTANGGGSFWDRLMGNTPAGEAASQERDSLDFIAAGGHAASSRRRRVRESRRARGAIDHHNRRSANTEEEDMLLEQADSLSMNREDFTALQDNEEYMALYRDTIAALDEDGADSETFKARMEQMSVMSNRAGANGGAMTSLQEQIRTAAAEHGESTSELRNARFSESDIQAAQEAQARMRANHAGAIQALSGIEGTGPAQDALRRLQGASSREDRETAQSDFHQVVGSMDRNSEEYSQLMAALQDNNLGALGMSATQRANDMEVLGGGGRRGRRQAQEHAEGILTGQTVGEMSFTGRGGQEVSGRRARSMLRDAARNMGREGEVGERAARTMREYESQLAEQLGGGSAALATAQQSSELMRRLAEQPNNPEAQRAVADFRTEHRAEFAQAAQSRATAAAERRDPLGVARNQHLQKIAGAITGTLNVNIVAGGPDAPADPNAGGGTTPPPASE